jgi:hypothetical protein
VAVVCGVVSQRARRPAGREPEAEELSRDRDGYRVHLEDVGLYTVVVFR